MTKTKKKKDKLLELVEAYAATREQLYLLEDQSRPSVAGKIKELLVKAEEQYSKIEKAIAGLRGAVKRNKTKQDPPLQEPSPPTMEIFIAPRFRVEFQLTSSLVMSPDYSPVLINDVDAPTAAHAVVLTRRTYGHIKVLRTFDLSSPPHQDTTNEKDAPGQ